MISSKEQGIALVKLLSVLIFVGYSIHEIRSCQETSPLEPVKCEKVCSTGVEKSTPFDCECLPPVMECDVISGDLKKCTDLLDKATRVLEAFDAQENGRVGQELGTETSEVLGEK